MTATRCRPTDGRRLVRCNELNRPWRSAENVPMAAFATRIVRAWTKQRPKTDTRPLRSCCHAEPLHCRPCLLCRPYRERNCHRLRYRSHVPRWCHQPCPKSCRSYRNARIHAAHAVVHTMHVATNATLATRVAHAVCTSAPPEGHDARKAQRTTHQE